MDRLARSLKNLIERMGYLEEHKISVKSLQESIDTSTPSGRLVFHIFGALSEFERNIIQERTKAGLAAARARGRLGGRPKKLDEDKQKIARDLYHKNELPIAKICETLGISKPTLYKYIKLDKNKLT